MPTESSQTTTPSGLPVRVPQASIAPPLRTEIVERANPEERRPPEEIRRRICDLQDGTRRGRSDAQDLPPDEEA